MTALAFNMGNAFHSISEPVIVSLRQVASWDLPQLNVPCPIIASVPALQRGLVWSPQQVELLWDSIFRGFPIGSLVVSEKVPDQQRDITSNSNHHLLDGQQRANAIALGFYDPFAETDAHVRANTSESILWLDLSQELIPTNSTREYLIRVTTLSHPWGYHADDNASRLSAKDARNAIESERHGANRPLPQDLRPWRSKAPVPLAWLMEAIGDIQSGIRDEETVWCSVLNRLEREVLKRNWPALALEVLRHGSASSVLHAIYQGLRRSAQAQLLILKTPNDILRSKSRQEQFSGDQNAAISNIEHLFNRLNRQGTPLDGEELAYSMIKAYWPESANVVENVGKRRLPASRLVALAVRAALTRRGATVLASGVGIPRLRTIAQAREDSLDPKVKKLFEERIKIEHFIGRTNATNVTKNGAENGRLARACERVERWIAFDVGSAAYGLPPVLASSFARDSSDIYLFLIHIADELGSCDQAQDNEWRILLPGLVTLIHWFARGDKLTIANTLLASVAEQISPENVRKGLAAALEEKLIIMPCDPDELNEFIQLPEDGQNLMNWKWYPSLVGVALDKMNAERLWPVLERTRNQRELLLYGQRNYLHSRFSDYDPSRKDLWADRNRPWDFDHIHAGFYFSGKQGVYADFCREWGNCIGNLRAWPFEDNRSDQDLTANKKLTGKKDEMTWSLIESKSELDAFSLGHSTRHEPHSAAHALSSAIKARYLRIYRDWYEATGIISRKNPRRTQNATDLKTKLLNVIKGIFVAPT